MLETKNISPKTISEPQSGDVVHTHPLERSSAAHSMRDELQNKIIKASDGRVALMLALFKRFDARKALFEQAGTSSDAKLLGMPALSSQDRERYFRCPEFLDWVAFERLQGNRVLWLTDLDKAKAAGDAFVYFFDWRRRYNLFTPEQAEPLKKLLAKHDYPLTGDESPQALATTVLELWKRHETKTGPGISLLEFWNEGYWLSLKGVTPEEKSAMAQSFAAEYQSKIFPGAVQEHTALREAGVDVVIVTNGDADLARALAPLLGIEQENVAGVEAYYDENRRATGKNHSLEMHDSAWGDRPQNGKAIRYNCWCRENLNGQRAIVAGFDGDSAGPDGGAIVTLEPKLAGFMVNTPGEHDSARLPRFRNFVERYGGSYECNFAVLNYPQPAEGPLPEV